MKLWEKLDGADWKLSPEEKKFTLGSPTMDVDKYYHIRYLQFDGDLTLSFRCVEPIWVVCDKDWGESSILYGGRFTSFHKGWN